jgi:hypothetical protein
MLCVLLARHFKRRAQSWSSPRGSTMNDYSILLFHTSYTRGPALACHLYTYWIRLSKWKDSPLIYMGTSARSLNKNTSLLPIPTARCSLPQSVWLSAYSFVSLSSGQQSSVSRCVEVSEVWQCRYAMATQHDVPAFICMQLKRKIYEIRNTRHTRACMCALCMLAVKGDRR